MQNARWLKAPVIFQVIRSWEFYGGDRKRVVHGVTVRSYCGVKLQLLIGTKNGSCLSFEGCRCRSKNKCRFHYIFKMGMVLAAQSIRTVGQFCVEHVEAITAQDLPFAKELEIHSRFTLPIPFVYTLSDHETKNKHKHWNEKNLSYALI